MPTYSNSRLTAYENCPMQYRLRYVDEVAIPPRESVEAYLGKRVHEALEYLYVRVGEGYKPTLAEVYGAVLKSSDLSLPRRLQ
jgi:putative RecB family exonuclease